jgi:oligopeptide/dipeptide ABC transporter ATP-binding protein
VTSAEATADVLRIEDLRVYFHTLRGAAKAVDGVTFSLRRGERFGLVGESGSGKTTTALAVMRMLREPGKIMGGSIRLGDKDLVALSEEEMRQVRLAEVAMIPQGAMNSLNPVMRIRDHFHDSIRAHERGVTKEHLAGRVDELLEMVGLRPHVANLYPHELSGGMKQRVCIAIAISLSPRVILADEPTSALDVVVQRQVMDTLRAVQERLGASVLLVGHDMGLMAQSVDRLGVMYAGKLVEIGPVREIFRDPLHPYTQLLISSLPSLEEQGVFRGVPGLPPSLLAPPPGCLFHPRCPRAMAHCTTVVPEFREVRPGRWVACHLY